MPEFRETTGDDESFKRYLSQNFEVWGGSLTLEKYIEGKYEIEKIIKKYGLKSRSFALFNGDDLLAGCTVLDRPLHIAGKSTPGTDHGIAGVHVPPQHRRNGYAQTLIDNVVSVYKGEADSQISLWSDVKDFYARSGFSKSQNDTFTSLVIECQPQSEDVRRDSQFEVLDTPEKIDAVRQIHDDGLKQLANEASGAAVAATEGVYQIALARPVLFANATGSTPPTVFGAKYGKSWVTWSYLTPAGMVLTLGAHGAPDELAHILRFAAHCGHQLGLKKVEFFETTLLNSEDFPKLVDASKKLGLNTTVETPREKMQPMFIGTQPWVGRGGYGWY